MLGRGGFVWGLGGIVLGRGGRTPPSSARVTAVRSGYFPSPHWLPLKSSRSRAQNIAPKSP